MDKTDAQLIHVLRRDGRISISDLASHLGLSRATARSRFEALQNNGEIIGFTAVLKSDTHEKPVRGISLIRLEGKVEDKAISSLDRMPEVLAIHTTNGLWDLIVELGTESLEKLDAVLRNIRLIDGVANSETSLCLSTRRNAKVQNADSRFD